MQEPTIDTIPSDVRKEIDSRLDRLFAEESVKPLLVVESGSRAWGFPSPDSDYDVRFIYLRPRDDYLSLSQMRDVIERPIVDEIDLNGWDVRKAIGLLLKSNSVVSEWLESPIRYRDDAPVLTQIRELADACFNPRGFALHYASLGRTSSERWLGGEGEAQVKKYFYALRPALAIRCLRRDPSRRPPMNLQRLVERADIDTGLQSDIAQLVQLKAVTNEKSNTIRLPDVERLIAEELEAAQAVEARDLPSDLPQRAQELFLEMVNQ
ncbi:MAG: nucleotidyltransferase domain-containing protein [Erythrobacter sp.]